MSVKANENTGLVKPDAFYFGNAPGNDGTRANVQVDITDISSVRNSDNRHGFFNREQISDFVAYNRDGLMNVADVSAVRDNRTGLFDRLAVFTTPAAGFATGTSVTAVIRADPTSTSSSISTPLAPGGMRFARTDVLSRLASTLSNPSTASMISSAPLKPTWHLSLDLSDNGNDDNKYLTFRPSEPHDNVGVDLSSSV